MNKWLILGILLVFLVGCTREVTVIEERIVNRTVYLNQTIVINNTVPYNETCPEPEINTTIYDRDYVLGLIQQLKRYEKQQDKFINQSSCMLDLNRTEYYLEQRELELCLYYNVSWC